MPVDDKSTNEREVEHGWEDLLKIGSSAVTGAAAGAVIAGAVVSGVIGTATFPGVGTVVGGILGAILGARLRASQKARGVTDASRRTDVIKTHDKKEDRER